ncbi:MAG: hypothetical protein SVS85_00890 [Candidatus Nanohaloarchaea archaeon]|nr:hypothetical protein [Candidatus Nanohaloarchaea archaeon]
MSDDWKEKTVSLGNVDSEDFESDLAHVRVSENGVSAGFKDVEDWKRIQREVGEEKILKDVDWEEVEEVSKETEHLYYPHIDIETGGGEKRLYFKEDEEELLDSCLSAIERYWNAHRQRGTKSRNSYSYSEEEEREEGGPEEEEAELEVDEAVEDSDNESGEEPEEEDDSVEDVVEDFIEG